MGGFGCRAEPLGLPCGLAVPWAAAGGGPRPASLVFSPGGADWGNLTVALTSDLTSVLTTWTHEILDVGWQLNPCDSQSQEPRAEKEHEWRNLALEGGAPAGPRAGVASPCRRLALASAPVSPRREGG